VLHDSARREIIEYLIRNGPLRDAAGRTTAKLRSAVSYDGTYAGFTQLIAAMERSGELKREVRGKRTYSIMAVSDGSGGDSQDLGGIDQRASSSGSDGYDYNELAASLLVRVVNALSKKEVADASGSAWVDRRLKSYERRYGQLKHQLIEANTKIRQISDERDELKRQLEQAQSNISILHSNIDSVGPDRGGVTSRLTAEDKALLTQMRRISSSGDRVGTASAAD
jgi:hypothetical protein